MFNTHRDTQYELYQKMRKQLISDPNILINLEEYFILQIKKLLEANLNLIKNDYNEASYLYPFWQQYPPNERGRKPRGDQYPWIEVGEHAIGDKLPRLLLNDFKIRDIGLPTGPDKRFILTNDKILKITKGLTDSIWLFVDIKSVGPRDDFDHTVMSHNQISGNGEWNKKSEGVKNLIIVASGKHIKHDFYCSIPPLYVLSDKTVAPVILIAIKPVYKMLSLEKKYNDGGQPLKKISLISIPNGLLLEEGPKYLKKFPGLFFPGKDDKSKNPQKVRSRISFQLLRQINTWRIQNIIIK